MRGFRAVRSELLLKVTYRIEKFLDDLQVGTQSPVEEIEQQEDKSN